MVPWKHIPWALTVAVVLSSAALAEETKPERKPLAPATPLGPVDENPPKLFHQIGLDFKNVFTTKENLWILGAGAGASLLAHPFDDGIVNSRFNREAYEGGALDTSFESGKVLGGTLFQVGAAFTTYAIGKASSDPELTSLGRDLVRAQIVTQGLTQAVKLAVQRPRPDGSDSFSFPSGHSSSAFANGARLVAKRDELFYRRGNSILSVRVRTEGLFDAGAPVPPFEGPYEPDRSTAMGHTNYDVTPDGRRFLMVRSGPEDADRQIRVVLNWAEELKALDSTR